jgi:hypothetical protein
VSLIIKGVIMKDEKWEFPFDGYVCPVCGNPVCNECGKCNDTKCTWDKCFEAWDVPDGWWDIDYSDKT